MLETQTLAMRLKEKLIVNRDELAGGAQAGGVQRAASRFPLAVRLVCGAQSDSMTPEFAKAVDPVFLHVLGLLERIGPRRASIARTRSGCASAAWLDQAEGRLGARSRLADLAKYALVSWIDEVLIEAPWEGRELVEGTTRWSRECFNTQDRSEQFYLKAKEASGLPQKDALEVFYVCVVLGFRGLYRDPVAAAALAEPLQLPPDLETWARQTSMAIQLRPGPPADQRSDRPHRRGPAPGRPLLVDLGVAGRLDPDGVDGVGRSCSF